MPKSVVTIALKILLVVSLFLGGCFQDYTVDERYIVSGSLLNKSEQQEVGFAPLDETTFSSMDVRFSADSQQNVVYTTVIASNWEDLPVRLEQGEHFELWGVTADGLAYSYGKFIEQGGRLVTFVDNNPGGPDSLCTPDPNGGFACTFEYQNCNPTLPAPGTDLDRFEVTLERDPIQECDKDGSILMSGNTFASGTGIQKLEWPISFATGNVLATASIKLFFQDAQKGLVEFRQNGFPRLTNKFKYELRALDEDQSSTVSCGSFNIKDGDIVSAATDLPLSSNTFKCGTDLTQYEAMIVSLEPTYDNNSAALFDYIPYRVNYAPFTSEGTEDFPIYNLRTSIAGASEDRGLSDVVGNFTVMTTLYGPTYAVFRGINHEPNYEPVVVDRESGVTDLGISMVPKIQNRAVFHLFAQDYAESIQSATVVGSFEQEEAVMNDSGTGGDRVKSDGVWTAVVDGITEESITYEFRVNGKMYHDPHGELIEDGGQSKMNIR